jgi:ribosomal protein S18 acetylase RimI-like enzyme
MQIRALLADEYCAVIDFMALLEPDLPAVQVQTRMQQMQRDGWQCVGMFAAGQSAPAGIAGYSFRTHLFSGLVMYVENVAFLPHLRGQGLGEQLMQHLHQIARAHGAQKITLDAYQRNQGAQKFYQRLGYDPRGVHFVLDLT